MVSSSRFIRMTLVIVLALMACGWSFATSAQDLASPVAVEVVEDDLTNPPDRDIHGGTSGDEVGAAAVLIEANGETGNVYFYDTPEYPGSFCWLLPGYSPAGDQFISLPPVSIEAAPGRSAQFVRVFAESWSYDPQTNESTVIDGVSEQGTIDPNLGYINLGDPSYGFVTYARWSGIVFGTLYFQWFDESLEVVGDAFVYMEYYDNSAIGGGVEDACYFSTYAPTPTLTGAETPTPTPIPGGFVPGDPVQTRVNGNLRSGPSTSAGILAVVPKGSPGQVIGFPTFANGYTWYRVEMYGYEIGYMANVTLESAAPVPTQTASSTATTVATSTPTLTSTQTSTPTATLAPSLTSTPTQTAAPSLTPTPSGTPAPSLTATPTQTIAPSLTPTSSATSEPSLTPTQSPTGTATATPTSVPGAFAIGTTVENRARLRLRSGPGTTYATLATMDTGTIGVITGAPVSANGYTWYPVDMQGYGAGWTAGEYLIPSESSPTSTAVPSITPTGTSQIPATATPTAIADGFAPGTTVENRARLRLRSGPGTTYATLATMDTGTIGVITGAPVSANGYTWYPVDMQGYGAGWTAGEYLIPSDSSPTSTAVPSITPTGTSQIPATATPTAIADGFAPGTTVENRARLRLRSGPGTTYATLATMDTGTIGVITGAPVSANGYTWYPVDMQGYGSGWTAGEYLREAVSTSGEQRETTPTADSSQAGAGVAGPLADDAPESTSAEVNQGDGSGAATPATPGTPAREDVPETEIETTSDS